MKVNLFGNIYKNKFLKKGLELAADNGALFVAGTSLALSTVARPIAIYSTPKTDKENRKLACAKSIASSSVGFGLMLGVSLPVSDNIKKINDSPQSYLKPETIKNLKDAGKALVQSSAYKFSTQLIKLGLGAVMAIPKAVVTCALIPPVMSFFFKDKKMTADSGSKPKNIQKNLTFMGNPAKASIAKELAKIINNKSVQNFSNKYKDTNYPMHIAAITDTVATGAFMVQTKKNKNIEEKRKNVLMNNAAISTGLCIVSSYAVDKALDKPTKKFIENFKKANKKSPKLDKYIEGIKIAKPALIMGSIYYCAIPVVSTFFAERFGKRS